MGTSFVMGVTFTIHATGFTGQQITINLLGTDFIAEFLNLSYNSQMNWSREDERKFIDDERNPKMMNYL